MASGGIEVSPGELDAAAGVALRASDQLAGTSGALSGGGGLSGDAIVRTANGYGDLSDDWRRAARAMADGAETLGAALRGAAEAYRGTDDGVFRSR